MTPKSSALVGENDEPIALVDVTADATLDDLLAEVSIAQTYRNDEDANIEAVYTFALPVDAVLLELRVELGERVLEGVIVERSQAEEDYEDALEDGDAAVLLQQAEPGLYTMNVGNLLPRETARITLRYAMLHRWSGDTLRFLLPTTVAPRYGPSPLAPHQVPESSLTVENLFSLRVTVPGALARAQFDCPSHPVTLQRHGDTVVITLEQRQAAMDRDFLLNVKAPAAARSVALCGQDGDGAMAIASFQPFFPGLRQPRPLSLAVVIDCSGSMAGDSIAQAKQALAGILDRLRPDDRIGLVAFGSHHREMARRLLACTPATLAKARAFADALQADMGGTEIEGALERACALLGKADAGDILLVTDGEVGNWNPAVDRLRDSGHRVFTVGVGSAVAEAFLQMLATTTGGACERVSPTEDMAERIVRHFERLREPRARRAVVHWPDGCTPLDAAPLGPVFRGDTVTARASMAHPRPGTVATLELETDDGHIHRETVNLPAPAPAREPDGVSTIARVAAAIGLSRADDATGLATALRYRLVSPWTHCLVIAPRDDAERASQAPELRKVPHRLAAGWGGSGTLMAASVSMDACELSAASRFRRSQPLRDAVDAGDTHERDIDRLPQQYRQLLRLVGDTQALDLPSAQALIERLDLGDETRNLFDLAAAVGVRPDLVAAALLAALLKGPLRTFLNACGVSNAQALDDRVADTLGHLAELARASRDAQRPLQRLRQLAEHPQVHEATFEPLVPGELLERIERLQRLEYLSQLTFEIDRVLYRISEEIDGCASPA